MGWWVTSGGGLGVGGGRGFEMGGRRGLAVDVEESIFVALVEALAVVFAAQHGGVGHNVGIEVFILAVVKTEGFERVEVGFLERLPDGALELAHVGCSDGVGFGDDGHDGGFALESAQDLEVEVFVKAIEDAR